MVEEAVLKVRGSLFLFGKGMEEIFVYEILKAFILLLRQPRLLFIDLPDCKTVNCVKPNYEF